MKNLLIYIILVIQSFAIMSCYKDKGNYDYKDINRIGISQIDTINGYTAELGDTLSISPVLVSSQAGSEGNYTYEWSIYNPSGQDRVISTEKNLKIRVGELPGSYSLQFKVSDKTTDVLFHVRAPFLVKTAIYQGYMVLNNVNGQSRLDMLSYDLSTSTFMQYTDVLKKMNSSLPPQGEPYKVVCTRTTNAFNYSDSTYGIYLLTATGTNRIHPETFNWRPTYDIRYEVAGDIAADFKAQNLVSDPAFYYITLFLYADNNVFPRTAGSSIYNHNLPVNRYAGKAPFKAAPFMVSNQGSQYLTTYDMDKRAFAMLPDIQNSTSIPVPVATKDGDINYPTGHDLLYMEKNSVGTAYAVTKDPASNACYLTRFIPGSLPTYSKRIMGTDIDKATHFTVSAGPDYLFYTVGGKIYEYDLSLQTSKLMADKGSSTITYMNFVKFSAAANVPGTYGQWAKWLTVGYSDPNGTEGSNGTLEQYAVPDANEALILKNKWTGFGNITSISYRERR